MTSFSPLTGTILTVLSILITSNAFVITSPSPKVAVPAKTTQLKATWSNGQAIREYQDFLASGKQEIDLESDGPSVIVTSSIQDPSTSPTQPIVDALLKLGRGNSIQNDLVVTTTSHPTLPSSMESRESYPIYIAIPPSELHDFLRNLPDDWKSRREDFIFLSGGPICGVIEPILKQTAYARDAMTQLLLGGFSVPPLGSPMVPQDLSVKVGVDANMEDKWAGESYTCGKWAGAVQERLNQNDIRCKTGFYREWRRFMWERAAFDAVFNLIGAVREDPTTIKDVANYYEEEASDMFWQVTGSLRGMLAVTLSYGFEERLFGFAEQSSINADTQCELNEEMYPFIFCPPLDRCKMVAEYLNYAKDELGMLQNTDLPPISTKPSLMRQGNLRADGVI